LTHGVQYVGIKLQGVVCTMPATRRNANDHRGRQDHQVPLDSCRRWQLMASRRRTILMQVLATADGPARRADSAHRAVHRGGHLVSRLSTVASTVNLVRFLTLSVYLCRDKLTTHCLVAPPQLKCIRLCKQQTPSAALGGGLVRRGQRVTAKMWLQYIISYHIIIYPGFVVRPLLREPRP